MQTMVEPATKMRRFVRNGRTHQKMSTSATPPVARSGTPANLSSPRLMPGKSE